VHRQADKFEQATAALKAMPLREKDVAVHADIVKRYESYALAYRGLSDAYERNDPGAIQVAREKAGELLRAYADPAPVPMHVDDELSRIRSAKPKEDPKLARLTAKRKQGHLSLEEAREAGPGVTAAGRPIRAGGACLESDGARRRYARARTRSPCGRTARLNTVIGRSSKSR
jgi:hypothetical protein